MIARLIADQAATDLCVTPNARIVGQIIGAVLIQIVALSHMAVMWVHGLLLNRHVGDVERRMTAVLRWTNAIGVGAPTAQIGCDNDEEVGFRPPWVQFALRYVPNRITLTRWRGIVSAPSAVLLMLEKRSSTAWSFPIAALGGSSGPRRP
jgi:hypothetical protein